MATLWLLVKVFLKRYWQDVLVVFLLYLLVKRNYQYKKILKQLASLSDKIDALGNRGRSDD